MDEIGLEGDKLKNEIYEIAEKFGLEVNGKGDYYALKGEICFEVEYDGQKVVDSYSILIQIPLKFPLYLPKTWETQGRIPIKFHRNPDKALCLGTAAEIRISIAGNKPLTSYIEQVLVRYLHGFTIWEKTGKLIYGERPHGDEGIIDFYKELFCEKDIIFVQRILRYIITKKRYSRKKWCPCMKGHRMRRCHGVAIKMILEEITQEELRKEYIIVNKNTRK